MCRDNRWGCQRFLRRRAGVATNFLSNSRRFRGRPEAGRGRREHAVELGQERQLIRDDLAAAGGEIEPLQAVDLGEAARLARAWGPFHREAVAGEAARVEIPFDRPGMDDLAALLLHRRQRDEIAGGDETGFLGELALRGRQEVEARLHQAFGDGPGAIVALGPVGAARVGEQDLQACRSPEHQQARAHVRMPCHGGGPILLMPGRTGGAAGS